MKFKAADYFLTFMKAVIPIVLSAPALFLVLRLFQSRASDLQNLNIDGYFSGYGLLFFVSAVFIGVVGLCALLLTGLCILIACLNKSSAYRKSHRKFFLFMLIAPAFNMYFLISAGCFIANIGN